MVARFASALMLALVGVVANGCAAQAVDTSQADKQGVQAPESHTAGGGACSTTCFSAQQPSAWYWDQYLPPSGTYTGRVEQSALIPSCAPMWPNPSAERTCADVNYYKVEQTACDPMSGGLPGTVTINQMCLQGFVYPYNCDPWINATALVYGPNGFGDFNLTGNPRVDTCFIVWDPGTGGTGGYKPPGI
ncbi:MAG: hypothetical protein ACHREM_09025 [Polyangiales bacterium]